MKKRVKGQKLSRAKKSRKALYRSLIRALVENGQITTTKSKAKYLVSKVEYVVNKAKVGGQQNHKAIFAYLGNDKQTTKKLFENISKMFDKKQGGYLNVKPLPKRRGDSVETVILSWSGKPIVQETKKDKKEDTKKQTAKKDNKALSKIKKTLTKKTSKETKGKK